MKRDLILISAVVIVAFFALVCVFIAGFVVGRGSPVRAAGRLRQQGYFFGAAPRAFGRFGAFPPSRVLPSRGLPLRGRSATGSLQKVDGQTLTIQTPKGITETVLVDNQTRFMSQTPRHFAVRGRRPRYGSRGLQPATLSDLKPGDRIIVTGQRNTQRQIIARTLILLDSSRQGSRDWRSEQPRPARRSFPFRRFR